MEESSGSTAAPQPGGNHLIINNHPDLDVGPFSYDLTNLPESLLLEILVRLPVETIHWFKCASKHWLSLISLPFFSRSYMNITGSSFRIFYRYIKIAKFQSVLEHLHADVNNSPDSSVLSLHSVEGSQRRELFKFLGSSNGLILICRLPPVYYVCNPVTRQWVTLPQPMGIHACNFFGEGIVSQVNQENVLTSFRVVSAGWLEFKWEYLNLGIYSSETGEWIDHRLLCPCPIQLLKRGGGPIHFNGSLHWFVRDHGMVAFDPYKDSTHCRLIKFPEDRDVNNEYRDDGLYRLCDECQGELRYFEVAPEASDYYCFSMWVLKDYEQGEWVLQFKITRSDLWSNDPKLSDWLMCDTFVPLCFHPLDSDVVYLRCVERSCIVSYNIHNKRLDFSCKAIGVDKYLSWRVVTPFVLPVWPAPVPLAPERPRPPEPVKQRSIGAKCSSYSAKKIWTGRLNGIRDI